MVKDIFLERENKRCFYALSDAAVRRSSKMGFSKFCNIHRKTLLLINVIKKRLKHRWFSLNMAKFLRTLTFTESSASSLS